MHIHHNSSFNSGNMQYACCQWALSSGHQMFLAFYIYLFCQIVHCREIVNDGMIEKGYRERTTSRHSNSGRPWGFLSAPTLGIKLYDVSYNPKSYHECHVSDNNSGGTQTTSTVEKPLHSKKF